MAFDSSINLGECSWIRIVGFWYIGLGDAIGVMDVWYPGLYTWAGIGDWQQEDDGLEYIGVDGSGWNCG